MIKSVVTALVVTTAALLSILGLSGCTLLRDAIPNTPLHNIPNPNPGPGNIGVSCVTVPNQPPPLYCQCIADGTYGTKACPAG